MASEPPSQQLPEASATSPTTTGHPEDDQQYRCVVVDSGPIIRIGMSSLWNRAQAFYTVPAVLEEIRDAKARDHLENLAVELVVRDASPEGIHAVVEFSKQTGDYQSLSSVDLQVLGLLYDLEREGCSDMSHVRKNPKRMLGLGKIESLGTSDPSRNNHAEAHEHEDDESSRASSTDQRDCKHDEGNVVTTPESRHPQAGSELNKRISWAKIVNPSIGDGSQADNTSLQVATELNGPFGPLKVTTNINSDEASAEGQFSDAEEDEDGDRDAALAEQLNVDENSLESGRIDETEKELKLEFPSLAASLTVPYEGSDDENDDQVASEDLLEKLRQQEEEERSRKYESLRPVSKSGKHYNSFRKYGDLMKAKPKKKCVPQVSEVADALPVEAMSSSNGDFFHSKSESRIIGAASTLGGQEADVDDDGEGWITCTNDIRKMKAAGSLDPRRKPSDADENGQAKDLVGPPLSQRAACTTTDFAMQNVILQMGLELLSVDGMKVRKLKSWVTRCGACYKVYTSAENEHAGPLGSKRLFCAHCGSDMMQRIAASVDGKTGRLRLHLSKKYRHNLRGTKYSMPKPGTGNRFQGDLLLREDQLLTGAWNQKLKMRSGGKAKSAAQSIFGKDIAANVGCQARSLADDDIRVGFGRRNPNAAKGRERRGKKKKSADKACGLRRY